MVNFDVVMNWMEYIRNNPDNAYRFSENFWPSQIESKKWLLEHVTPMDRSIVIFGGWYGVLAQFIAHKFPGAQIVTTDLSSECKKVFDAIDECYHDITFRQHDMRNGMPLNNTHPDLGNNLENPEHVRLADNLAHFLTINNIKDPQYAGMLKCGHFYRYMAVGYK